MKEKTLFLNMFSDYEPPEPLQSALSQAAIVAADLDPASRKVAVAVEADTYIPQRLIAQLQRDICGIYGLVDVSVTVIHPADQLQCVEPEELLQLFVRQNSMTRGSLAGATWQWEDTALHIHLVANGKKELEECIPSVKNALLQRFGVTVDIQIHAGEALEGEKLFEAMEKLRRDAISEIPVAVSAPKKEAAAPSETFLGKPFRTVPSPMREVELNMGLVTVEGRVFAVDHKELTKRNAVVIKFDITDNTGSVRVSRFLEKKEADPIMQNIKVGSVVKVAGKLMIDNFTNEMVLKPNAIMPGSMPKRVDKAQGDKRVELHLHTSMSNMDALTDTKAAIKQAAAWGHKAIAITDHGCVHAFTDAMHVVDWPDSAPKVAGTDKPIKILYGCEGYYVNDVDDRLAVQGSANMPLDGEYVAFDLETTGLYRHDTIIEIGAVRMKGGEEIDRFQAFVDPKCRLHPKTVELTGITDDMLRGAKTID